MGQADNVVQLFWTGGWDSTFRLLQLLLIQKKKVQPYYLIDEDRLSNGMELRTMKIIKRRLFEKYPETKNLMLPTIFKAVYDIQPNQEVTKKYNQLLEKGHLGTQYEWLGKFCKETGMDGVELGIIKTEGRTYRKLRALVVRSGTGEDACYKLDERHKGTDEYAIFHFYSFPLISLSKIEMKNIARKEGFEDLLDLTWFCHTPRNNRPCGVCTPCVIATRDGLGYRIPLSGRIRYYRCHRSEAIRLLGEWPRNLKFLAKHREKNA